MNGLAPIMHHCQEYLASSVMDGQAAPDVRDSTAPPDVCIAAMTAWISEVEREARSLRLCWRCRSPGASDKLCMLCGAV